MNQAYRDAITQMEEMKVQQEYILGWQGGFLGHPQREEQRLTEAYEAGYERPKSEQLDEACPDCGEKLLVRSGRRGAFIGCSGYPKCKTTKKLDADGKPID